MNGASLVFIFLVTLSVLTSRTVLGFRLREARQTQQQSDSSQQQQQSEITQGTFRSPANALVRLALEEFDANNDDEIELSEVGAYIDQHVLGLGPARSRNAEVKGYMLTVVSIADVDDNGMVTRTELRRAASKLINLAGVVQVGRCIELKLNYRNLDMQTLAQDIAVDFRNILDSNNDGLVSSEEVEAFLDLVVLRWARAFVDELSRDADSNNDGNLSQSEARQFLSDVATDYPFIMRRVYVYTRVHKLAGKQAADLWAGAPH